LILYPKFNKFEGDYYLYFLHTDDSNEFVKSHLEIRKKWNKISAKLEILKPVSDHLSVIYKGDLKYSDQNFFVRLVPTEKKLKEYVNIVFYNTIHESYGIDDLWGVGSCISTFWQPCIGKFLLTKKELEDEEVKHAFDLRTEVDIIYCDKQIKIDSKRSPINVASS
jgi:hypothetical protein